MKSYSKIQKKQAHKKVITSLDPASQLMQKVKNQVEAKQHPVCET